MKKFLLIIFIIFFNKTLYSYDLFETSFHKIELISNNIEDSKISKIDELKRISLLNILEKTLDNDQLIKIKSYLSEDLINTFVKNIIINDEIIINDKYYSNIKINFNKNKIILFYRENKIPYVEYLPNKILLVIYEINDLDDILFSKNNNYYSYYNNNLLSKSLFKIPKLDINDRYIFKKEHILKKDKEKILNFSNKYKLNDTIVVIAKKNRNKVDYKLLFYSNDEILETQLEFNKYDFKNFFTILENETLDLWKKINHIQNKSINIINCKVNYFNSLELKEIRDNLTKISIIQNLNIKSLSYKSIEYDIHYYGNLKILYRIFKLNKLTINEVDNSCTIRLK